jgi:hypothetical protein
LAKSAHFTSDLETGTTPGYKCVGDFSSTGALCIISLREATILRMTKERWARIGITTEFLIVVRALCEFFRLRQVHATNFSTALAAVYVGGALIATCSCWMAVSFYFFRRYTLSAWIALATVPILVVYKIAVIGW